MAGEGAFLARHVLARVEWGRNCKQVDLESMLGREVARAACAYAVACLAAEGREGRPPDAITRR